MDFVSPITEIVSRVIDCCAKHLNYLRKLEKKLNQLKEKMEQLNEIKSDINNKVLAAEAQLMVRTKQVNGWMQRVDARRLEVEQISLEVTQDLESRCLNGCCPRNCWSCYKLGKKVVKKLEDVEELMRNGVFEIVAENRPLALSQELPVTSTIGLDSLFDRAWNFLGDNSVRIMGLYGMGGVGKTTLLKKINNEFTKRGSEFEIVMWVMISKEVNMARIQEEIGKKLRLLLPTDANDIFNMLNTKKFLLLLDDIWERIDLESIGVPSPSFQNKSKIVFTTRLEAVCGHMEADKIIKVECLNWEAAWALFQEKVGYAALNSDSDIPKLAEIVANECRGLPLALITIGRSMASKKTCHEWEHAISVLKNYAAEFPGMGDGVLPLLKFSYDSLPNDSVRLCFLFCSLYPEDYSIEILKLIDQWIGEGYISGYDNFKEALNTGHHIIGILKGSCLLEEADGCGYVKMHDVIRDLALWIASECGKQKYKYFVQAGVGLSRAPKAKSTMVEKISWLDNNITQLECIPKCPNLSTLLVSQNARLKQIHDHFFLSMPALKLLDLSNTSITKVPTSICELYELEFLDLSCTCIESLPYKMMNLTKLKCLFLLGITYRKYPRGIIKNLSNLEFLKLDGVHIWDGDGRFLIDELLCLKQLKSLEIRFHTDIKAVKKFLNYSQFADCARSLSIINNNDITSLALSASSYLCLRHLNGLQYLNIEKCSKIKELELNCIAKKTGLHESLERLVLHELPNLIIRNVSCADFRKLHYVDITDCHSMVELTWLLLIPNLQRLVVGDCDSLQEIISSDEPGKAYPSNGNTFSNLKVLSLRNMWKLQSICSMTALPLPSLEMIDVLRCPRLRRLPLDLNSAKNTFKKIKGDVEWWNGLQWENETVEIQFFKFLSVYT